MGMTVTSRQQIGEIDRINISWTSDGSGNASLLLTDINGDILRAVTKPGSPAPTGNHTLTFIDEFGIDLFAGQGVSNRDTANAGHFCPGVPFSDGTTPSLMIVAVSGDATLAISGAGSLKSGMIVLLIKRWANVSKVTR